MKTSLSVGFIVLGHVLLAGCGSDEKATTGSASGGSAGSPPSSGGGANAGGSSPRGGAPSSGGALAGGAPNGGTANGGSDMGGQSAGGSKELGGSSAVSLGGNASGGANLGGTSGADLGGAGQGGNVKGGATAAGGSANGGNTAGGSATGGRASGGSAAGGAAAGGRSSGGTAGNAGGGNLDPHGFTIRLPASRQVTCAGATRTLQDADWICTFNYGATKGFVYVQSTPVNCVEIMGVVPTFSSVAQISINGQVTSLSSASYDWGGNHHNDMLSFTYGGNGYDYYHSSFGFGWRSCNNMDCLQVSVGATGTVTEDGCTSARSLPQVCSKIAANGTYTDLSIDSFAKCPGDTS